MNYEEIKDFEQRCECHPDHQNGMVTQQMIRQRMEEEIKELRDYIERRMALRRTHENTAL